MAEFLLTREPSGCGQEAFVSNRNDAPSPQGFGSCNAVSESKLQPSTHSAGLPEREGNGRNIILLVEDEETLLMAVSKMLRKKGYSVLEAINGDVAVDLLRRYKGEVALILLDVNLPGLPSREVFDEARRIGSRMPVILTSAFSQNIIDSTFAGMKVDHFIRKPYRLAAIVDLVQNVIAAH